MAQLTPNAEPDLDCGLPWNAFNELRDKTPIGRLNLTEAKATFDALDNLGFKIVPKG